MNLPRLTFRGLDIAGLYGRLRALRTKSPALHHWWWQRITAVVLVPLSLWFAASLITMVGAGHSAAAAWIGSPGVALLLVVFLPALCYHGYLGVEAVMDDYVHIDWVKAKGILAVQVVLGLLAVVGVLAVMWVLVGLA
ncbi:MAG: succinate dehydrogenase, hydrophobic membrane anchor protein [Gammaproteobacteria bacterium]